EETVLAGERRAVGQEVLQLQGGGMAGARVGIDLIGGREPRALARREVTDLAIRVGEVALIGEQLVVEAENGVARQDLAQGQRIASMIGAGLAKAVVERYVFDLTGNGVSLVLVHPIPAAPVTQR